MEPAITAEIGCRTEHLMSHFDKLHRLVCHACIHVSDSFRCVESLVISVHRSNF